MKIKAYTAISDMAKTSVEMYEEIKRANEETKRANDERKQANTDKKAARDLQVTVDLAKAVGDQQVLAELLRAQLEKVRG